VDEKLKAQVLLLKLTQAELTALKVLASGESLRHVALRLSIGILAAAEIKKSMMRKIGASRDADAVRLALYAELAD
jgi:DNA-binding CsgD family transcriptional regulator